MRIVATTVTTLVLILAGCSQPSPPTGPRAAIDPQLAACMPRGSTAFAGLRVDEVRASPLYPRLREALTAAPLLDGAVYAVVALDGREFALAAKGNFAPNTPGLTVVAPGYAAAGPLAAAAIAQHATGQPGEPALLAWAEPLAREHAVWVVIAGGRGLPLSGNAANINRLLRATDYATLAVDLRDGIHLTIAGHAPNPVGAIKLEQTLRGLLTLSTASVKQPETVQLLRDVRVSRAGNLVTAALEAPPERTARLLDLLLPAAH